eukprot:CAMPEP_0184017192 /NCGR_PEP_ID=MMETSP0954-20121128/7379_1 /TAXON_ID=627963 /ORGANISM="Aplanochytrium sp, Strain PBS07" /LENGTH=309 /DNA_ID=CAMNT_0026298359 /DNA_START=183 /DNA_END=1109 /DNA_ORIENTATION=-
MASADVDLSVNSVLDDLSSLLESFDAFKKSQEVEILNSFDSEKAKVLAEKIQQLDSSIEETKEYLQGAVSMYDDNMNFVKNCETDVKTSWIKSEVKGNELLAENDEAISAWSERNNKGEEQLLELEKKGRDLFFGATTDEHTVNLTADNEINAESKEASSWRKHKELLNTLYGFDIRFEENSCIVETPEVVFKMIFDDKNFKLKDVQIIAGEIKKYELNGRIDVLKNMVSEGIHRNDPTFLLRELRRFSQKHVALSKELDDLKRTYPLTQVKNELVITLPEGIIITLHVDNEYPNSSPRLVALDGFNGW